VLEVQAAGLREEVMPQSPEPTRPSTAAGAVERQVITIIHQRAEVITITIATIIPRTGYFTGFPGRIAAGPYATTGGRISPLGISGRTTIAGLSLSASADTGPATHTGATTGTDGTPTAGTAAIHRNM
jgi:hypothetical protein